MATRPLPLLALLAASAAVRAPAAAAPLPREQRLAVVLEAGDERQRPVLERIRKTVAGMRGPPALSVHEFRREELADPIVKGRLLAALAGGDFLVALGDGAAELVTGELEDVPLYFAGVSLLGGERLAPTVSGTFSYNVDRLLDAAQSLWSGRIGLAYTPGYEPFADWVRRGAAARGLQVRERVIATPKDLAPAVRDLLEHSALLWLAGDPLLARGAGFQFVAEQALSREVPVIAAGGWEVRHGALLAFASDPEALAAEAAAEVEARLRSGRVPAPKAARLRQGPARGVLLFSEPMASKWKVKPPPELPWRMVR